MDVDNIRIIHLANIFEHVVKEELQSVAKHQRILKQYVEQYVEEKKTSILYYFPKLEKELVNLVA